jgi:HSP20 family molecular chaperone IbpA
MAPFNVPSGFPTAIDVDKAEAVFRGGVLKLTLPKAAEAKAKPISITA